MMTDTVEYKCRDEEEKPPTWSSQPATPDQQQKDTNAMSTTWNPSARDVEDLTRTTEQLEAEGQQVYALIITEQVPFTFDGEKKTLWCDEVGALDDIASWLEEAPNTSQVTFCEKAPNGVTQQGEQLYAAPGQPLTTDAYIWWQDVEQVEGPKPARTVLCDTGYADAEDLQDPTSEAWDDMASMKVHDEPLPVTIENLLDYAHHYVFAYNAPDRIEIIPARELIAEVTDWLNEQQADEDED